MENSNIKLPADIAAKYDLVKPFSQIIIQKPEKKSIIITKVTLDDAKVLAEKGFLKEKSKSSLPASGVNKS